MRTIRDLPKILLATLLLFMGGGPGRLGAGEPAPTPPWPRPYGGEDAVGDSVLAFWPFRPGNEGQDASGHGHDLSLRGLSRYAPEEGRFGTGLESFPADAEDDHAEGASTPSAPGLSPEGAFTIELWFRPKEALQDQGTVFLLDKKYYHYAKDLPQANGDYCLLLEGARNGTRAFAVHLGYGTDSAIYRSRDVALRPNTWVHFAFTYDGKGTGRFFLDRRPLGRTVHRGRGAITPGSHPLVLGDRVGSTHAGFPGFLDEVRLSRGIPPAYRGLEIDASMGRWVFCRGEADAHALLTIFNDTGERVTEGELRVAWPGRSSTYPLPDLAPGEAIQRKVPVDTSLRPAVHALSMTVSARAGARRVHTEAQIDLRVVPSPLPGRMPIVMWGTGDLETLGEIGFTHQLVHLDEEAWVAHARELDRYLAEGIFAVAVLNPGRQILGRHALAESPYARVDRGGTVYTPVNTCALFPRVRAFATEAGRAVAHAFAAFPALQAALIHSELRDGSQLCFHPHDVAAYRKFSGHAPPAAAVRKTGVRYETIDRFPESRLVSKDDPILRFYRWFWKQGDGWNDLNTLVHQGLQTAGRTDLWTFFDPAVRVPSVWGSGGDVDVISHWTYTYPDPIKIGQATDELLAMADGAAHPQRVMKMTQIIWYRSQTAPKNDAGDEPRAAWEREQPDARFITIAPDHLREAFWSEISRPIQGIMFHGWASLVPAGHSSYCCTHPGTRAVLQELIHDVVTPLGPTLLQVPDAPMDVAILESFASQIFAGRGTYGWGKGWEADAHLVLQWAGLQPKIVYDETVERDGLKDIRILVLPHCDVLPRSVARIIQRFRKRGGLVVADEMLAPGVEKDILLPAFTRSGKADEDKAALQALALRLREALASRYERAIDASNPDVVVRRRRAGTTDYLFALNDKRTFGDYVGQHGRVMERGIPTSARLEVKRRRGYVYDLVRHQRVASAIEKGTLSFDVDLGPGGGRVFMITRREIDHLRLDAPRRARRGDTVKLHVAVVDRAGRPLDAVVPVRVGILDPRSRSVAPSACYGAKDGKLTLELVLAPDDEAGPWTLRVEDLASGRTAEQTLLVE